MDYWRDGDPEPADDIDVLVTADTAALRYLARFQHGWTWVAGKTELGRATPLTWRFATAGEGRLRPLTNAERAAWDAT